MPRDPFQVLGLDRAASAEAVRSARRTLARRWHPDRVSGQGPAASESAHRRLAEINEAADLALAAIERREAGPGFGQPAGGTRSDQNRDDRPAAPPRPKGTSFTVRAGLPQVFQDLVLAAAAFGEPQLIDAPRSLEIAMDVPVEGVARVTVAPRGEVTRVSVSMADRLPQPMGRAQVVRDELIDQLNFLEQGTFGPR